MKTTVALLAAVAFCTVLVSCGIFTAPVSVPAAVAENASFSIRGPIVDEDGQSLQGVIVKVHTIHHFWTPVKGSADVTDELLRRRDGDYDFDTRGSSMELIFSKEGYYDTTLRMDADAPEMVRMRHGQWNAKERFPVVMLSIQPGDAPLRKFERKISYANYPVADCVALPNVAADGRSGEIIYTGKNAEDPTLFPAGTLYLTLDKEAPQPINAKGDLDPSDLDIPHHVTLHLPGKLSGFIPINPQPGYDPLATSDEAPAEGYSHELTFSRARLKAMRVAPNWRVAESHEYFFFRAGEFYGKGEFSWGSQSGEPAFQFVLYIQPNAGVRNLTTHRPGS